ncbi:MAG TPA: hypothetical protein PLN56_06360 [Methanoregulaceae archaeon]|nr:MAG: hypothetical protein IPI71_09640 [Methanolinea sp.]HON81893.1 hypothetical protein [Methanoregulaceae archaeon]HPD10600.1 hypothetical protein [Methanoregulaceae archaeon]HRT15733.1 hypothetical protein [Methanoregulaceae archaeon]HRU31247.1 hypothetical protein [Methanoregulaceae archaeon]
MSGFTDFKKWKMSDRRGEQMKTILLVTGSITCMICLSLLSGCISSPVQESSTKMVAARFLENSDNLSEYRINATIKVFQNNEYQKYRLRMFCIRPYQYYIEWSDLKGNITDVFITNGTMNWHILPVKNEAYYSYTDFLSKPMNGYDVVAVISELLNKNIDTLVRNSTVEENGKTYGIEFHSEYYAGMQNCSIILAIDRNTYLPVRMLVYGSTGSLQQDITFDNIDKDSLLLQDNWFNYIPPVTFNVTSDSLKQTSPLYPLYTHL